MCRYLLSKGASTTATNTRGWWFPMYAAALGGHLDVCKWMYIHGAEEDIGRRNVGNKSPLGCANRSYRYPIDQNRSIISRWFILKGAAPVSSASNQERLLISLCMVYCQASSMISASNSFSISEGPLGVSSWTKRRRSASRYKRPEQLRFPRPSNQERFLISLCRVYCQDSSMISASNSFSTSN